MAVRPIDEIRGTALKAEPLQLRLDGPPVYPDFPAQSPINVKLLQQPRGPVWVAAFADGTQRRAQAKNGHWIANVDKSEAGQIARAAYLGNTSIVALDFTDALHPPLDLRKARPAWRARFADRAHVYVDAESGEVLALRTANWRTYDWMWGLHIMDLGGRENTSNRLLQFFAALSCLSIALAVILLPLATRWRRRLR